MTDLSGLGKVLVLSAVLVWLAVGVLVGLGIERPYPLPQPIYVVLPDTTHLHLSSFEWICTIRTSNQERYDNERSRIPQVPPNQRLPAPPPPRQAGGVVSNPAS